MAQQLLTAVENNFTKGLITEGTGLDFPENAATDTDNCEYTLIGDTLRRQGINFEANFTNNLANRTNQAVSSYKWNNVGGDGLTQVVVEQVGSTLYFYRSSTATIASPLSAQKLPSTVNISAFVAVNGTFDSTVECQYSDGNGYLFVYHPSCDPFYCTYNAGVITGTGITVQVRDFTGISEIGDISIRPSTLSNEHNYNLLNQGWTQGNPWYASSFSGANIVLGSSTFTIQTGLTIPNGQIVNVTLNQAVPGAGYAGGQTVMSGTVTSYTGGTGVLVLNIFSVINSPLAGGFYSNWVLVPVNTGYLSTWFTAIGNYPSNSDVWWYFKNTSGVFDPTTRVGNVTLSTGNAPKGHYLLNAFQQQRTLTSGVTSLTDVTTTVRPRTGTWYQGRVWFTGVDSQQPATGDAAYYTWTENIYFSQTVSDTTSFGRCYQTNDPTSENLFGLLPTDGGVITIQGCGSIFKLFPIQNGLLVFAANGVWFVTGSQGIGFAANDYTITKISSVQSISCTSFIDVQGLPYFWNEEGIYQVTPSKNGSLEVNPLTIGTILTFYNNIPLSSKKYVRGAYHPIDYVIQWIYKDTEATSVSDRYAFNKILNFNTYNKAFFPFTVDNSSKSINGIIYVGGPGGSTAPTPVFKYIASTPSGGSYNMSFAEENSSSYVDWGNINYTSYFITGFKLRGQAIKKFQPIYLQLYTRATGVASAYKVQAIWDFANNRNSGRWSSLQVVEHGVSWYNTVYKRVKLRGRGFALQFKITSVDGRPFDIQGWAVEDIVNQGT